MSTRERILSLLRREAMTVPELSARLEVTRNAVIVPLRQLEADGLVEGKELREKRVGKPAVRYAAVPGREDVASRAYPSFAELMVQMLPQHLTRRRIRRLMQQIGHEMASLVDTDERSSFSERLKAATSFIDDMGAGTVVEATDKNTVVRSFSCPLGRAVRQEPCVCSMIATFLADVTGAQVDEQCDRSERLRCKFVISPIRRRG